MERGDFIRATASEIRDQYSPVTLSALKQIASDRNINVVETPKALVNISIFHPGYQRWFIFYRRSPFLERTISGLAHELGHAILDHRDRVAVSYSYDSPEEEADFFAETLTDIEPFLLHHLLIDEALKLIKHPLIYLSVFHLSPASISSYAVFLFKAAGIPPFPPKIGTSKM